VSSSLSCRKPLEVEKFQNREAARKITNAILMSVLLLDQPIGNHEPKSQQAGSSGWAQHAG
jgi:hypothetical protein